MHAKPKIKIRLATLKDLDQLVDLQIKFEKYFQEIGSCEKYTINKLSRKKDLFELNFKKNHIARTLVAEMDNKIVGRVTFYKGYLAEVPPVWIFRLSGIYVNKQYRSMGVAKMLFDKLIKIAQKEKIKSISWSVWKPNLPAVKFYENLGGKYYSSEYNEEYMFYDL